MAGGTAGHDAPGSIEDIDVSQEMETSFLEYAYSVIYSRALPDARDGLKPVQRRIVYQMGEMGLRPDRGFVKSSRIVGDVMGKLHPHGDTAIYDALVRLAQPFTMRLPLVDGHGNFGSLDDGPAAPRYTEARLHSAAMAMIAGLDEDVVSFVPNYDGTITQPEVLPAAFPNLLVNGASGIAVGMATNMAPHNAGEVIAAAQHLIRHPDATLDELMRFVPGPDLPSGGRIIGLDGVREAYETGRGTFRTRASVRFENLTSRRKGIVVTELPYLVGPEKIIERVKDQVQAKRLTGIASIDDFSDRKKGMRLVIGIKTGFDPKAVLEELYRLTPMEDSFGINNVCLVDGQPRTLGLRELLQVYVDHRIDVVRRRTAFRLGKAKDRLHLVEGLLIAILDIDEVIQLIRSSDDAATARGRLMEVFDLSEVQATYILDLQLRRLTRFSRLELEAERDELRALIEQLERLLADEGELRELVARELGEIAEQIADPRRTVLVEGSLKELSAKGRKKAAAPLTVADDPCWVLLSTSGRIARTANREPLPVGGRRASHDALISQVPATAQGRIAALTSLGRLVLLDVVVLPQLPETATRPTLAGGVPAKELVELGRGETVLALVDPDRDVFLATAAGVVKRAAGAGAPSSRTDWEAITLKGGDTVVGAAQAAPGTDADACEIVLLTSSAQLLRFSASVLRAQGWAAGGVAGIKLAAEARVIAFSLLGPGDDARVVTIARGENFYGDPVSSIKVSDFAEFPAKGRATGGVRAHRFLTGETELALGFVGRSPLAAAAGGGARNLPEALSRRDGSGAPLEAKIDAVGTVPFEAPGGAAASGAAGGSSSGAGVPGTDGSAAGRPGVAADSGAAPAAGAAGAPVGAVPGMASGTLPDLETEDDSLAARREEIARSRTDDADAVIVSHDEDGEDGSLF
ncbi:DNA gyrase/topoisomerase IV subunit A [Brevibacterium album]|uniref:DNA gyrase/topoisomerase IV subunit A n=1 Tax=Brevibacterium album TaxID=417948 RepID=UPI00040D5BF8|nr:DNA topoisomerase IV subunit A [Brevibacterium album]